MKRIFAVVAALLLTSWPVVSAQAHSATPEPFHHQSTPSIVVPCDVTEVPWEIYSMPITQTETLTLHFQSSGNGSIIFTANTYHTFYDTGWQGAACGDCTLVLPNVSPGDIKPGGIRTMQLALDASTVACPDPGITIGNFSLEISPTTQTTLARRTH